MNGKRDIGCDLLSLAYDFRTRCGELRMPDDECCDMSACVALFEVIDPSVKKIETYAGAILDTVYWRSGFGWEAGGRP